MDHSPVFWVPENLAVIQVIKQYGFTLQMFVH